LTSREDNRDALKILVVDDEEHIRRILQFQLEKNGYIVVTAENGEVALRVVHKEAPDLVILDLMMPKIDGFEVCRRLRSDFQTNQIPIIMLTAKTEEQAMATGIRTGANQYLTKPIEPERLLSAVAEELAKVAG